MDTPPTKHVRFLATPIELRPRPSQHTRLHVSTSTCQSRHNYKLVFSFSNHFALIEQNGYQDEAKDTAHFSAYHFHDCMHFPRQ